MKIYIVEIKKTTEIKLDEHVTRYFHETEARFIWPEVNQCLKWINDYASHDPYNGFHWRMVTEYIWMKSDQHLYTTNKVKNEYGHIENYDIWMKSDYIPG